MGARAANGEAVTEKLNDRRTNATGAKRNTVDYKIQLKLSIVAKDTGFFKVNQNCRQLYAGGASLYALT